MLDLLGDADEILAGRQTGEAEDAAIIGRDRAFAACTDAAEVLPQTTMLAPQQRDRNVDGRIAVLVSDLACERAATPRTHLHLGVAVAVAVHSHTLKLIAEGVEV